MNNSRSHLAPGDRSTAQLRLFESTTNGVPDRFRIDEATRRRGMRHIARIRAQLEARYPTRPAGSPSPAGAPATLGRRAGGDRRAA